MTLKRIKKVLIDFFETHAQINSVYYCNQDEYIAIPNKLYSSVNIDYVQSNLLSKSISHSYKITLSDLYNPNIKDHDSYIYSTLLQIVEDFEMYMRSQDEFTIQNNIAAIPFSDDTVDRTSGFVFSVYVSVARIVNECQKPLKTNIDAPEID